MRKRQRSAIALVLACSMILSLASGGGGAAFNGADTEEKTDTETGYTYELYQEKEAEGEAVVQRARITGYSGSGAELALPSKIGQYQVGSIGDGAFKGNAAITSVTIPSGITCIGYEAFQGCENLKSVSLPPTITDWSDHVGNGHQSSAFAGCTALSQLTLPEGLASIGQNAFQGCVALESVTIPSTIQTFRDTVFSGCTSLVNLELKEGIRQIGYRAFQGCTALEEVTIPSTIESWATVNASGVTAQVHDCAPFIDCTSLKKIVFREGLKTLQGFQGTRGCPKVKELDIPASVEDIAYAFTGCEDLEKVILHEGIKTIGTEAFRNCTALRKVDIPDTVTTIQYYVWDGCTSLERLVFPPLATTLGGSVTSGCTSLRELYVLANAVKGYQALELASDGKLYCIEGSGTYGIYQSGMPESVKSKLTPIPATGAEAIGSELVYDGGPHPMATLKGTQEGDEIRYRVGDGEYQKDMPQITEPGTYDVEITVRRQISGQPMHYSSLKAQAVIGKRQYVMHLSDLETEEGKDYAIAAEGYQGAQEPAYAYYLDAACTQSAGGKPEVAGEYYVRASIPETDYDLAVQSNVAKITIRGKGTQDPGASATQNPGQNPGTEPTASLAPGENPSASQTPGTDPGGNPSASQIPGTDPGKDNPSASTKPGASASASPSPMGNPTASPSPGSNSGGDKKPGSSQTPKKTARPGSPTVPKVGMAVLKKAKSISKKTLLVQWKKVSKASGYQIQVGLNRKFAKGKKSYFVNKGKAVKKTIRKLRRKKKYYVRIRAYKTVRGKRYYGKWSKVKTVKIK